MSNLVYNRSNRRYPNSNRQGETDEDTVMWYFCFGDSAVINSYLKDKIGWKWIIPKFLNALFRGISQVVFANNPFSGVLILTGIFWFNLKIGYLVLASISIAVLTAVVVNIHPKSIIAGIVTFNAVLLSSVTSSLWTPLYKEPLPMNVCIAILIGSAVSVLISNGVANVLSSCKPTIPILSIPFHILVFLIFPCLKPDSFPLLHEEIGIANHSSVLGINSVDVVNSVESEDPLYNRSLVIPPSEDFFAGSNGTDNDQFYTWGNLQNVVLAATLSSGQVFGFADIFVSLLIYAAILMYSPILTFMCFHGAFIGTVLGLFLTPFPNDEALLGVWGFNGFLACGTIGVFYIFNLYSFMNGTINAVFTAVIQFTITSYFTARNMPVFGLPFLLSTLLFVNITSNGPQLVRVKNVTFPEHQRSCFKKRKENETTTERNLMSP